MKDYVDLFNKRDAKLSRQEEIQKLRAPMCCCCEKRITENEAVYYEGDWFCNNPECMKEFYTDMESKYRRETA
jgi:hypothetical protein